MGGIIGFLINLILDLSHVDALRESAQMAATQLNYDFQYTNGLIIAISALGNICLLLCGIGLGAGIGALGGLLGKKQSPIRPFLYPPQPPYPPTSYPPQPPYPPVPPTA
jgi:hypothetical protein